MDESLTTSASSPANAGVRERALEGWTDAETARALHPADRDVVQTTEAARSLILELFGAASPRDLFNACARLGGLMAAAGASPSLAAGAIDACVRAMTDAGAPPDEARVGPARSACLEGYVATIREAERISALASWEYPACVVPLAAGEVAIACGYPEGDAEALAAWAARVAAGLVRAKIRTVVLSGREAARTEVTSAVELVGIRVRAIEERSAKSWLPWRRS